MPAEINNEDRRILAALLGMAKHSAASVDGAGWVALTASEYDKACLLSTWGLVQISNDARGMLFWRITQAGAEMISKEKI